jgi:hypothetical protein
MFNKMNTVQCERESTRKVTSTKLPTETGIVDVIIVASTFSGGRDIESTVQRFAEGAEPGHRQQEQHIFSAKKTGNKR